MTREPSSTEQTLMFRARDNTLFFNNLTPATPVTDLGRIALRHRFAQTDLASQSKQRLAAAEHRPASRPGAD